MRTVCRLLVPALSLVALTACFAAERPALDDLGRTVKMRILVDKVMQPVAGWKTEEWMVKEAAAAGFNVFSPRLGADNPEAVKQVTTWCRQSGIYHVPWMRGTLIVPKDRKLSDGKRMVWANGSEQELWSPNSDELWQWLADQILPYARLSVQDDSLYGVFLDYENYSPGGMGNCYDLSYDDTILGKFAAARGLALPALELKQRKAWLEQNKLHEAFAAFQIAHWRERCRTLRAAVDKINPRFRFIIYPAPGTPFMLEACYPEWATKTAPLVLADPWTYGRSGRYVPHEAALKTNQATIERGRQIAADKKLNTIYLGGIDPVVTGADPEFSGKNALMLTGLTDGYWIFYEGPVYAKDHPDYFHWFAWANERIAAGDYAAAAQPRQTEDPWAFPRLSAADLPARTARREYPVIKLRGSNALLLAGHKGAPVVVDLQVFRVGRYENPLNWTVKDTKWEDVAQGEIKVETKGTLTFTPAADGLYVVLLDAGANACAPLAANAPLALFAEAGVHFLYTAEKLYFQPPAGLKEFTLNARGQGVETIKVTVMDPAGQPVATAQTTPTLDRCVLKVPVGEQGGKVWSLTTARGDEGALEDNTLAVGGGLSPVLSYFPDEVFTINLRKP